MPDELWMEVRDIEQETAIKKSSFHFPKKKKCKKAKWLSEEALQIAVKREVKSKSYVQRMLNILGMHCVDTYMVKKIKKIWFVMVKFYNLSYQNF